MRIVQVSAHFPPDFVSGGTLMPQRCAQAMAERGHESYVFAGDLNSLQPLREKETVENGIPVHWIGISPFLSWADVKNYNNPAADKAFARYLATVEPDIVHFHALQTLGGGLLDTAREVGAKIVVTMHDFWWICSRQFLVDREFQPCSIVRDCGECQCAVTSDWLTARNSWLAERLAHADLILVPSAAMGQAIIANGIPAKRVRVNENGVDPIEVGERRGPASGVRFLYAGGGDRLKGFHILADAVTSARVHLGTSLSIYGANLEGSPGWVESRPAFDPTDLPDILARHDVLIVPSLARESHSILTREALSAGLAVITSNTPGPSEAVEDGRNGRVIAPGSTEQLTAALEELSDPAVAAELMGRGSVAPTATPQEQMAELEAYYHELVTGHNVGLGAAGEAIEQLIRSVVIITGIQGASCRYRAHLPVEALATRGIHATIHAYRDPVLPQRVLEADAVIFYRVPATPQVLDLMESIRSAERMIPIIGDVDDLIFDPEIEPLIDSLATLTKAERDLWREGIHRYRTTFENCDYFIGSTQTVSREATRLLGIPAHTYHNGVSALLAKISEREMAKERTPGPLRVGFFSGTKTHDADWASIEPAIARVLDARPEVELWLGGLVVPTAVMDPFKDRIVTLPLVPWQKLPSYLRDVDVCLAPLTGGSIFNEAKSAIKWLEAALVETPTVASPTQPFREVIRNGETGFLASAVDEWTEQILALLDDDALRAKIGSAARQHALLTLSPAVQGEEAEAILREAWVHVGKHGHRARSHFPPVANDEPYTPLEAEVEPYEIEPSTVSAAQVTRLLRKVGASLRHDGLRVTAGKAATRMRSLLA